MQPGETITPNSKADKDSANTHLSAPPTAPKTPEPEQRPVASETPSPWQYSPGDEVASGRLPQANIPPVSWSASEFIDNEKNAGWFIALAGITAGAVALIYLITRDLVTVFVVIMAATLFGVTAKRKPRTLQYQLDHMGVNIEGKLYPYDSFKSFAMMHEGAFNSIQLMPLKRFMPPISLYYPPESEDQIMTTLGSYLPHEDRTHDPIERLMRRVRF